MIYIGFLFRKPSSLAAESFLSYLIKTGYGRILTNEGYLRIEDCKKSISLGNEVFVVVDRLVAKPSNRTRMNEAITTAINAGYGNGQARDSEGQLIGHLHEGLKDLHGMVGFSIAHPHPCFHSIRPLGLVRNVRGLDE